MLPNNQIIRTETSDQGREDEGEFVVSNLLWIYIVMSVNNDIITGNYNSTSGKLRTPKIEETYCKWKPNSCWNGKKYQPILVKPRNWVGLEGAEIYSQGLNYLWRLWRWKYVKSLIYWGVIKRQWRTNVSRRKEIAENLFSYY